MKKKFTDKELLVRFGKIQYLIDRDMLDRQKAWSNLALIKKLHMEKLYLEKRMKKAPLELLKVMDAKYTKIEFALQKAWGFKRSRVMHKFWNRPRCKCPKIDNDDRYPSKYCSISPNCPLHGDRLKTE